MLYLVLMMSSYCSYLYKEPIYKEVYILRKEERDANIPFCELAVQLIAPPQTERPELAFWPSPFPKTQ